MEWREEKEKRSMGPCDYVSSCTGFGGAYKERFPSQPNLVFWFLDDIIILIFSSIIF